MQSSAKVWIPLVVFAVAFGGVLAWRMATPHHAATPHVTATGDWDVVLPGRVDRTMNAAAASYRQRFERTIATRRARAAATRWLTSLPAGNPKYGTAPALPDATVAAARTATGPRGHVADITAWAHALPSQRVQVSLAGARIEGDDAASSPVTVRATFELLVRQSLHRFHHFSVPLVVTLRPSGGGDDVRTLRWTVSDVRSTDAGGLRALQRPVLLTRDDIDLLADGDHRTQAIQYANQAQTALHGLRPDYIRLDGPESAGLYLVKDAAAAKLLLGSSNPDDVGEPSGWTTSDGDVVLLAGTLDAAGHRQALGTVRHEIVHVITLPGITRVPTLWMEGVASWEETSFVTDGGDLTLDLEPLYTELHAGTMGYDQLLRNTRAFGQLPGATDSRIQLDYLAAYATVAYLEQHSGHDKVVELIDRMRTGTTVDVALDKVLGMTPAELQKAVRVWTKTQVRRTGGDVGDASGDTGSGQDPGSTQDTGGITPG